MTTTTTRPESAATAIEPAGPEPAAVAVEPAGRPRRRKAFVLAIVAFVSCAALVGAVVGDATGPARPGDATAAERGKVGSSVAPAPRSGRGAPDAAIPQESTQEAPPKSAATDEATVVPERNAAAVLPGTGPRVVRTASLTVVVERAAAVDDAVTVARSTAESNGGYVADLERTDADGVATASATLRVPAAAFDEVTGRLERIGDVATVSLGGDDVTQESVDLEARLRSLQSEADALRAILAKATTVADILAVRQQLNGVQTEIETVTARSAQLNDAVAFATVTATFTTSAAGAVPKPRSWWGTTLGDAVARLGDVVGAIVVGAATLLPIVAVVAVAWGVWVTVRRRRRAVV